MRLCMAGLALLLATVVAAAPGDWQLTLRAPKTAAVFDVAEAPHVVAVVRNVAGTGEDARLEVEVTDPKHVLPASAAVNQTLMLVGAASIVVGALAAIGQKDLKRMLAYSSISQVGYIILGLGVGLATLKPVAGAMPGAMNWTFGAMSLGLVGAIFHLFNHAIFKSLLFVNAAAVEQQVGTTQMSKMGGLSPRMPVTNATNVLAILSTAGVPPLSGFWSKLIIIIALWQAGQFAYAFVAIGFSVVTLAYLLLIQRRVFFGVLPDELANVKEAGGGLVIGSLLLAGITLGLGLLAPFVLSSLQIRW